METRSAETKVHTTGDHKVSPGKKPGQEKRTGINAGFNQPVKKPAGEQLRELQQGFCEVHSGFDRPVTKG